MNRSSAEGAVREGRGGGGLESRRGGAVGRIQRGGGQRDAWEGRAPLNGAEGADSEATGRIPSLGGTRWADNTVCSGWA